MPHPTLHAGYRGVIIDDTMSMAGHVRCVCHVAYCHIHSIARIMNCVIIVACKTLMP